MPAAGDPAARILDAAGRCFADRGVRATTIGDVARAAGCSRPTVYRYFEDREALRTAFVHREARRLGAEVRTAVEHVDEPGERLVAAVLAALRGVRADPTLAVWFTVDGTATATRLAASSEVIGTLASSFLGETPGADGDARGGWVVRVTLSLLALPAEDEAEERALLERFLVPAVLGPREGAATRRKP